MADRKMTPEEAVECLAHDILALVADEREAGRLETLASTTPIPNDLLRELVEAWDEGDTGKPTIDKATRVYEAAEAIARYAREAGLEEKP